MGVFQEWAEERGSLAQSLGRGALGGSYADGAIILCAAIGAMASLLWQPTTSRADAKRFVEIVTRFRKGGPDTTRVSAVLFAADFPELRHHFELLSEEPICLTGCADKTEAEVGSMCDAANTPHGEQTIRRYSYANLLYKQVRCSFIHEYRPGKDATSYDPLGIFDCLDGDDISYVNRSESHDGLVSKRLIHFPLKWINAVVLAVAAGVDLERSNQNETSSDNFGLAIPDAWWIDGGRLIGSRKKVSRCVTRSTQ